MPSVFVIRDGLGPLPFSFPIAVRARGSAFAAASRTIRRNGFLHRNAGSPASD
jgi:hypothetical protein